MNTKYLTLAIPCVFMTAPLFAAEIYHQAGNKLDLYGLVSGLRYFSNDQSQDGDRSYMRVGFKGETQISERLTGYGQWQSQFNTSQPEFDAQTCNTDQFMFRRGNRR